jgi:hypothetical protein
MAHSATGSGVRCGAVVASLMTARLIITLAATSLLVGCWPARFTYRPGIEGTVISSDDGKPVAGASIRLTIHRQDLVPELSFFTARDGGFAVPPYYRWGVDSFLGEQFVAEGSVEIGAPGYLPYRQNLRWSHTGPRTQELGPIRLSKP